MKNISKAFTLIELLVTISIIGILSTLLVANFNSTRQRARDAQRKSDLRNIQTALRLYYNDYGEYPLSNEFSFGYEWLNEDTAAVYMNIVPQDPQYDATADENSYSYTYIDADDYALSACLENKSDDKCGVDCNGGAGCLYTVKP